jgi:ribose/xylose/arabinose/galactoside ABC-type transport system permease subunit
MLATKSCSLITQTGLLIAGTPADRLAPFACFFAGTMVRYIYAVGANEAAARIPGAPAMRANLLHYRLSGLFCALGAMYLYQNISATPGKGADYLVATVRAPILGGFLCGVGGPFRACSA